MTRLLFITLTTLPLTACSLDQITGTGPSDEERSERMAMVQEIGVEPECRGDVFRVSRCVGGRGAPW